MSRRSGAVEQIWIRLQIVFACSCWSCSMEEQEGLRRGACWRYGHLAAVRGHGVPSAHLGGPLPHPLPGNPLPLFQCLHFHPQVSFSSQMKLIELMLDLLLLIVVPADNVPAHFNLLIMLSTSHYPWYLWYFRSPPNIPEVKIPEDVTVNIALSLRHEINRGFFTLREIGHGRDLKKFLIVCWLSLQFGND